ncbi:MAG: carbohydrate-binding domain-containing protein [Clostridia bacterium]|nr:carbohydrate-binding domain-containing protein [Clostridia bacterium]
MNSKSVCIALILTALLLTASCSSGEAAVSGSDTTINMPDVTISDADVTAAEYNGDGTTVQVDSSITIDQAGTFVLTGTVANGQITVDVDKTEKVELVFNGLDVHCDVSAAVFVKQADKVTITLAEGSVNRLSSTAYTASTEDNIDGVLFSKDDLEIGGAGQLIIEAADGHGIVAKDDLNIEGGDISISAPNGHGLDVNDTAKIKDGILTLVCGKDGVHADNTEDTTQGNIEITGGSLNVDAQGDGLDASGAITISAGSLAVTTAGGAGEVKQSETMFGGFDRFGGSTTTSTVTTSTKGVKASALTITGGTFLLNTDDDALHANGNVLIEGGEFTIATGDDGVHADENLTINDGKITITQSYEGLEGMTIDLNGGEISLIASDDGLNAAGGNDSSGFGGFMGGRGDVFAADSSTWVNITGGVLYVNAEGDGLDSNGDLNITGGETYVSGPTNSGNGALDYGGQATISGGIVFAVGAQGMASGFGSTSTQCSVMTSVSISAGDVVKVLDSDGKELASFTSQKIGQNLVISLPEFEVGQTYTLRVGSKDTTLTISSTVSGSGSGMGGFGQGGNMGGGRGDMGGRGMNFPEGTTEMPEGMEMPEGGMGGGQKPGRW